MKCLSYIDGLVQERRNSSVLAMELRLSCTNPSICSVECVSKNNSILSIIFLCYMGLC